MLNRKTVRNLAVWLMLYLLVLSGHAVKGVTTASFSVDNASGCVPLSVHFTSTSTGAVSWYWDLGNGNSSTLENPTNIFTNAGNYTITLITYDGSGNTDTARYVNYISVLGKPTADFHANGTTGCPDNNSISFSNTSSGGTTYLWDFGDGTTSTQANPIHSYAYSDLFTVTLVAINSFGCQDDRIRNQFINIYPKPDATIIASDTTNCDPTTTFHFSNNSQSGVSWNWNFGDLTYSTLQNPDHNFPGPGNYPVSVIVTNTFGCKDTTENPLIISLGLTNWADFSSNADTGCAPFTVQFSNLNPIVSSSFWSFGDGDTSYFYSPSHTYTTGGSYTVSLVVTTFSGCADTVIKNNFIVAGVEPSVDFHHSISSGCAPLTVQFTNNSANFDSCIWFFGDGTTSSALNPTHTYTTNGSYNVTLQCWGPTGCSNSLVKENLIAVSTPTAQFDASPRIGCPPLLTSFSNNSNSGNLSYLWDFGDGNSSTQTNPTHNYTTSGNFDVTLVVTDSTGCRDTLVRTSFIQTVNTASNYIPPPTTSGCAPLSAQFTDATPGAVSWLWNFGDGTTSTLQNPHHIYTENGFYTVSLTTTSAGGGCAQTISNFSTFDVNGGYSGFTLTANICPPYIATFQDTSLNAVSWFWDFGDGNTSTLQNPTHTYALPGYHSVSLNITTADGCTYTTMQNNIVYFAPFGANFFGVPLDTVFPCPVHFYANSVGATSWLWDFGDGDTSTQQNPIHVFQIQMSYNVTLTISNGNCTLFYSPPAYDFGLPDTMPINTGRDIINEVQQGCLPLNVLFTNRVAGAVSWHWDFGDGDTSNIEFPNHIYYNPGIYTVTLTTVDTSGIVEVLQMDSIVKVSGPTAGFSTVQTSNCTNTQVVLTDSSSYAVNWFWNFGDGTTDTVQNPVHVYLSNLPNYVITQTVTDTMGCTASVSTSLFANFANPILASESDVCGHDTVQFFTSLQNFTSYLWNFGDGQTSTSVNPGHVYTTEGTFSVSLTASDANGCVQTFYVNPPITVRLPLADFSTAGTRQACNELTVSYINNSMNADSYLWSLGDGSFSSLPNPIHTYNLAGSYTVSLTVYRGTCVDKKTFSQYVKVDTAHAAFTYSYNQMCLPSITSFQDHSVNPVSWKWYFGDEDSSSVQNPSHTYTFRPSMYPQLIITDINGCKDSVYSNGFPMLVANFQTSSDSGCFPLSVQFTNSSSLMANNWFWNFGDGNTSTLQNPSHTYAQPGTYDITLIISSNFTTCTDTLFIPSKIIVKKPFADFISTDLPACAPSLVNFTSLSADADNYLWDFGDGTTSTNENPSHIYNTPGNYSIKLVTSNNLGCADSLLKQQYIQVLGPETHFNASSLEGCVPFEVSFTDHSINSVSYNWNFGDGYSDFSTNPVHVFNDTGRFTVSLVTQDTAGCTDYFELPQPVIVHPSPVSSFVVDTSSGCQPLPVTFTNTSTDYQYATWYFGDGDSSILQSNPVHLYTQSGAYNPYLVAYNNFGCADTSYLTTALDILARPVPQFSVNDVTGCAPFHVTFINSSTNLVGPQYLWNFGNGNTSTDPNPAFNFTHAGFHNISVTITNSNGCKDSLTYPSMIHIPDTVPPGQTKVLSVSVESNTSVKIIWENNPAVDLAQYIIYRSDAQMNFYRPVYTVTNAQNTNFAMTSEYVDSGLNTLAYTYSYKVQAIDTCGTSTPVDQLHAHTTINISSEPQGNHIKVGWTPYGGCPVSSYILYRAAPGEAFAYHATLHGDSLQYNDTTFTCPHPYTYRVMATDLCGNTYTSFSDTSVTYPLNILHGQVVDIVRSTVVDNQTVLTEWSQPLIHPEMVAQFDIYRSTDNTNFFYVASVPALQTDFMDSNVDVQNSHYYYKILVINTCDIAEDLSDISSTIILKGEIDENRQIHLYWTPYEGWENGVEYYIIEMKDENGNWQLLRQVNGSTLFYDYRD